MASTSIHGTHIDYKVEGPGVVTGRSGSLGTVTYLEEPFWPLNTTLWVKEFKGNLPRYVYYFLQTLHLEQYNAGTGVPTLNRNHLNELPLTVHPPEEQVKVAGTLSAYDELIQRNLQRIKILNEMQRELYREWFVEFRFPGHERMERTTSPLGPAPDGWAVSKLGDHVELAYGKALKVDDRRPGPVDVYGSNGRIGKHDRAMVSGQGIIVGRKGMNFGAVHWSESDFFVIDTAFYVKSALPLSYLYFNLQHQPRVDSHAAIPGLDRNQFYNNPLLIPPVNLLELFEEHIRPMLSLRRNLHDQNDTLAATRDLVLPKLISGEIDVSELDIDTSWLAA